MKVNKLKIASRLLAKYPELREIYKTAKALPIQTYTVNEGTWQVEVYLPNREEPYKVCY